MVKLVSIYTPRRGYTRQPHQYFDNLEVQAESCRRYNAEQIVITELPSINALQVFLCRDLPENLMHAILDGQLRYLLSKPDDDVMLVGADGLLTRDPSDLFDGSFDVAFTTHPFSDCILNTGLIAVARGAAEKVALGFAEALRNCGPHWGDDQRALRDAFAATLQHGLYERRGLKVRSMPVPGFNDAPDNFEQRNTSLIVHFRGPRKDWMRTWWALHHGGQRP